MRGRFFQKVLHKLWVIFAGIFIFTAIVVSVERTFSPSISHYKLNIEKWVSDYADTPISIEKVDLTWHFLEPVLDVYGVNVKAQSGDASLAHIDHLAIEVNIFKSLIYRDITPKRLILSGASFGIEKDSQGRILIKGLSSTKENKDFSQVTFKSIVQWLFSQKRMVLKNITLTFYPQNSEAYKVEDINLFIQNNDDSHVIFGDAYLDASKQKYVQISAKLKSDDDRLLKTSGEFALTGKSIPLAPFLNNIPVFKKRVLSKGNVDFDISGNINKGKVTHLVSSLDAQHLFFKALNNTDQLAIDELSADMQWEYTHEGFELMGNNITLKQGVKVYPVEDFQMISQGKSAEEDLSLGVRYIPLSVMKQLLPFLPNLSQKYKEDLNNFSPEGTLENLYVGFQKNAEGYQFKQFSSELSHINLNNVGKAPGVSGLDAYVEISPTEGKLAIKSPLITLIYPTMFRENITLQDLESTISWQREGNGWFIHSPSITAHNDHATLNTQFTLDMKDGDSNPVLSILGTVNADYINQGDVHRYIPVGILEKPVVSWLDNSIHSAGASSATIALRGGIHDFPYDHGEGTFMIKVNFQDGILNYYPDWPGITEAKGVAYFKQRSMHINLEEGNVHGISIQEANVDIPYMGSENPVTLSIVGEGNGDLKNGYDFLLNSPLKTYLGDMAKQLMVSGDMNIQLNLNIPLISPDPNAAVKVITSVGMANGELKIPNWKLALNNLQGTLHFDDTGLWSKDMEALLFNSPASFTLIQKNEKQTDTHIHVEGEVAPEDLDAIYGLHFSDIAVGKTAYTADINMGNANQLSLVANSNLQGIKLTLPEPLAKTAEESRATKVSMNFMEATDNTNPVKATFSYGDILKGNLRLLNAKNTLSLLGGELHFGKGNISDNEDKGLFVTGDLDAVNANAWRKFFIWLTEQIPHSSSEQLIAGTEKLLTQVNITIKDLNLWNYHFENLAVKLNQSTNAWLLNLASGEVAGDITIPFDTQKSPIIAKLKRLYIHSPKDNPIKLSSMSTEVSYIPGVDFVCSDFQYNNTLLDIVKLNLSPIPQGVSINEFSSKTENYTFYAAGKWYFGKAGHTKVLGQMVSTNVASTLEHLGVKKPKLYSNHANVTFELSWPDAPYKLSPGNVTGNVTVDMGLGKIVGLDKDANSKIGVGKLVTLLSLQSLPRRLQLNFSDLTDDGLDFNKIKANFSLADGDVTVKDASLSATVVYVTLKGRIGLLAEDYNLVITVTPHVTSSLPVVAAIAGGPVAGVVTWAVDKAISPEINKMTQDVYSVTGSWAKPKITPINSAKRGN